MEYTKEKWKQLAIDIVKNFEAYEYGFEDDKMAVILTTERLAFIYNDCEEFCKDWKQDVINDLEYGLAYLDANQYEMLGLLKDYCEYLEEENDNDNNN